MKEKEHFLDKNTVIAVIFVFAIWFAWDAYMRKKYPAPVQKKEAVSEKALPKKEAGLGTETPLAQKPSMDKRAGVLKQNGVQKKEKKERVFSFKSERLSFDISSTGMGFKKLLLNGILDRSGKPVWLFSGEKDLPFETGLLGAGPLYFKIQQTSDRSWEGRAVWQEVEVIKNLSVDPDRYLVTAKVRVSGDMSAVSGIRTRLSQTQKTTEQKKGFLAFLSQPDFLSFFVSSPRGAEQIPLLSQDPEEVQKLKAPFSSVRAVALGTKYFGQAWIEGKSDVLPGFFMDFIDGGWQGQIEHRILNPRRDFQMSYKMFIGPKDLFLFQKEQAELVRWVDLGWFGSLSRFILQILRSFYSLSGNWGVSIILLTLLVRLLLLPLVLSSHRSMETMKKVHPEIQKLRDKFKKDPQRMNQEIMALMKAHKANPLGGCLPLLLQIPVFWALWRALAGSYSLYQAPFMLWIKDLSWKDPYYVLPVLMGVFMFVQQKISPVTASKEIMKAMQIMPVIIPVFMINLPSGLLLYMVISTVFGLAQQVYLNKKSGGAGGGLFPAGSPVESTASTKTKAKKRKDQENV